MRSGARAVGRVAVRKVSMGIVFACFIFACLVAGQSWAQTNSNERAFPQSKAAVEKALAAMQASLAGRLPVLDGFAQAGEHPLDRYQRGYYQAEVQVRASATGGSVVQISTKVTAWYADPAASHSRYELLISNGRIEADILDQLAEQLAKGPTQSGSKAASVVRPKSSAEPSPATQRPTATRSPAAEPTISAPSPKFPETDRTFSSSLSQGLASEVKNGADPEATSEKSKSALQLEADSLEEVLKNQGHPKNLVAVKKSGTPVVATPSLTAKPEFLASLHDEFEMLDFNADWVHVRVSGLSRGWIWRNSVEMPAGIPDSAAAAASPAQALAGDLFHVVREETSTFPGDWEPLKNKSVKIISVQKIEGDAKDAGPKDRLEYAKFLLGKSFQNTGQKPQEVAGVVVIFDAADGGMIAAPMATLQQWKAGTLSDAALWHRCFFDPPETFDASGSSASQ